MCERGDIGVFRIEFGQQRLGRRTARRIVDIGLSGQPHIPLGRIAVCERIVVQPGRQIDRRPLERVIFRIVTPAQLERPAGIQNRRKVIEFVTQMPTGGGAFVIGGLHRVVEHRRVGLQLGLRPARDACEG